MEHNVVQLFVMTLLVVGALGLLFLMFEEKD